jgi:hypothetical protein
MQMETTLPALPASVGKPSALERLVRNRFLLGSTAGALIAAGVAWQWSWLVAIGIAPLLVSAAPCVAMCALGLCMHRVCSHAGSPVSNGTSENPSLRRED